MNQRRLWLVFLPYACMSVLHVASRYVMPDINYPTKLMLMPLLALAVVVAAVVWPRVSWGYVVLLLVAILFSWLGDGSGAFFPMFDDELPMMLVSFGAAHLVYMWIFWRAGSRRPSWLIVACYAAAYVVLMVVLLPHTGALMVPVALYGLVLVGTAILSVRINTVAAWGGFWFLISDAILAFRLFLPDALPSWAGSLVMITYTLGQGLIIYGVVVRLSQRVTKRR